MLAERGRCCRRERIRNLHGSQWRPSEGEMANAWELNVVVIVAGEQARRVGRSSKRRAFRSRRAGVVRESRRRRSSRNGRARSRLFGIAMRQVRVLLLVRVCSGHRLALSKGRKPLETRSGVVVAVMPAPFLLHLELLGCSVGEEIEIQVTRQRGAAARSRIWREVSLHGVVHGLV